MVGIFNKDPYFSIPSLPHLIPHGKTVAVKIAKAVYLQGQRAFTYLSDLPFSDKPGSRIFLKFIHNLHFCDLTVLSKYPSLSVIKFKT